MVLDVDDNELVGNYVREGSETAFRTLVSRHVSLVYGAALRQTGDAGMAEEITQNVFVALSRKAPRLAGHETLSGWLHRTAILESKARLRSEFRRQRREDIAAALTQLRVEGRSVAEDLLPVLDECLLQLREPDRLALILRFLEDRSLREVGRMLGVKEDAARKRVDRALERLAGYFRTQGFAVPMGAGAAVLTRASIASPAPAGLALAAAQAGITAGGATGAGTVSVLLFSLMNLSNLQTMGVCALLVAAPLAWQWNQDRDLRAREARVVANRLAAGEELNSAQALSRRLRSDLTLARADSLNARNALAARSPGSRDVRAETYRWDDRSPLARIPKVLLGQVTIPAASDRRGTLSPTIIEALQMTDSESGAVQGAMTRFLEAVHAAQAGAMRPAIPTVQELEGHTPAEVRVFEISGVNGTVASLRRELLSELEGTLGPERAALFKRSLESWIPMKDDDGGGLNSGWAFFAGDHRLRFINETGDADGNLWLRSGLSTATGSSFGSQITFQEIPEFLRTELQDWLDQAAADREREGSPAPSQP